MTAVLDARPTFALEIRAADTNAPRRARHWLAWVLEAEHLPQDMLDTVLLVMSELVTNATVHAGGRILVSSQITADGVLLVVHDDMPVADEWQQPGSDLDEHGRGLVIVEALAEVDIDRHAHGVTVTALIPRTAQ